MKILNAVIAHKDFEWNDLPAEDLKKYLVFTYNDIKTNIPNVVKIERPSGLSDDFYGEMSILKYIRHNVDFDWININHYRIRFELPNYNNFYVPFPLSFKQSVKEAYRINHNIDDLNLITDIIMSIDFNSDYKMEWLKSLEDNYLICYNMMSGPKWVFLDLINIYETIMDKFITIRNFKTIEDVKKHCTSDMLQRNHFPYRIGGFLAERINNCYFRLYAKKHNLFPNINMPVLPCKVKLLEEGMKI